MDYYERQQDRADNRRERTERDEDFAFEQRRQRELDNAKAIIAAIVICLCWAFVSEMDYREETRCVQAV